MTLKAFVVEDKVSIRESLIEALAELAGIETTGVAASEKAAVAWLTDCVTDYELSLLANDTRYSQCQSAADGMDSWYDRASQRMLCAAEFLAGAMSAETQFIACSGLAPLKIQ